MDLQQNRQGRYVGNSVRCDTCSNPCFGKIFSIYDLALPKKDIPKFEIPDVIAILNTFSSAGFLAILWTLVGLFVTGIFFEGIANEDGLGGNEVLGFVRLASTALLVTPIWIVAEIAFHWPPTGVGGNDVDIINAIILGFLGLLVTMSVGRVVNRYLP